MITIFTPTYNRAYTLPKLYESLVNQTSKDFEWLLVDDGSTDNTEELLSAWMRENKIRIRYFKQENSGKPTAHNRGVMEARGDLFTCVDSDDYLCKNAISAILKTWNGIDDSETIGILAFRVRKDGSPITKLKNTRVHKATLRDAYRKYGLRGDTMLVYRMNIIKKYSFPKICGEKFIPESFLYNKLDAEGKLYFLRAGLYVCEYLDDGYTKNVTRLLYNNYRSYSFHLQERINNVDTGIEKYCDCIRYIAVLYAHGEKKILKNSVHKFLCFFAYIPGIILALCRYGKLKTYKKL